MIETVIKKGVPLPPRKPHASESSDPCASRAQPPNFAVRGPGPPPGGLAAVAHLVKQMRSKMMVVDVCPTIAT